MFQSLLPFDDGTGCEIDSEPWYAQDQPSYVWAKNNSNYGKCLGTSGIATFNCTGEHPLVQRLCRCSPLPAPVVDELARLREEVALYKQHASAARAAGAAGSGLVGQDNAVSAEVPWGTELIGKTSDMDGYYSNVQTPFYKSIRVTAQLPPGTTGFSVYTIIRGTVNVPIVINGFTLPATARMQTVTNTNMTVQSLHFVPIVNMSLVGTGSSTGSGMVLGHTVAIQGHPSFIYLEGCFHLITPYTTPLRNFGVANNFPGVVLSTGMEDYYDSSFYFHAGTFQLSASGVTHMCSGGTAHSTPHPACGGGKALSEWSAYRFHHRDPLFFSGGVQLLFRNGDVGDKVSYGNAKCFNLDATGGPGTSIVSSLAWVYTWD
eukprot:gene14373-20223_t